MNAWLQHWQLPGSFRARGLHVHRILRVNPTLTILAQTLRTADAIVDRYLKRPGLLA